MIRFHYNDGITGDWGEHGIFDGLLKRGFSFEYHTNNIRPGDHLIVKNLEPDMDDPYMDVDDIVVVTKVERK